ncbi:MAG: hypothetical protein AAFP04_03545 [Myxococcota bacterium]
MRVYMLFLPLLVVAGASPARAQTLHFQSGFEPGSTVEQEFDSDADITGEDRSVPTKGNWESDLEAAPIGTFRIQYQGGDRNDRDVTIVNDPVNPANKALRFHLKEANVACSAGKCKGRIQTNLYDNSNFKEFTYRHRMMFHEDWAEYLNVGGWVILNEFWNESNWEGSDFPFRIHTLLKETNGNLRFGVSGERLDNGDKWNGNALNTFNIPPGEWFELEVYVKEGKGSNGRFRLSVIYGGKKTLIFDERKDTQHPNQPAGDGFGKFNPLKLYTAKATIDGMNARGADGLKIFYDDFKIWLGEAPEPDPDPTPITDDVEVSLIDARTDESMGQLQDGAILNTRGLSSSLGYVVGPMDGVASCGLTLTGPQSESRIETTPPFSLFGDSAEGIRGRAPLVGSYTLTVDGYSLPEGAGVRLFSETLSFRIVDDPSGPGEIVRVTMWDTQSQESITDLVPGSVFRLQDAPETVGFVAETDNQAESVRFTLTLLDASNGSTADAEIIQSRVESSAPYSAFGDATINNIFGAQIEPGRYRLLVESFAEDSAGADRKDVQSLEFVIE